MHGCTVYGPKDGIRVVMAIPGFPARARSTRLPGMTLTVCHSFMQISIIPGRQWSFGHGALQLLPAGPEWEEIGQNPLNHLPIRREAV